MLYLPSRDLYNSSSVISAGDLEVIRNLSQTNSVFIQSKEAVTRVTKRNSVYMFLSSFHKLDFHGPLLLIVNTHSQCIHGEIVKIRTRH